MARQIVVCRNGESSAFGFSKVDRAKLYGRRRRMPLDPSGERCQAASLTEDGSLVLLPGMTGQGYFTSEQLWVPTKELVGIDAQGEVVEKVPSTLGVAQELRSDVSASELLSLSVQSVYALEADEVEGALLEELKAGKVFGFAFNYRADYEAAEAYLIANDAGEVFALVGNRAEFAWRSDEARIEPSTIVDEEDDDDDDLDFEMF